jgi:hypothetical protein
MSDNFDRLLTNPPLVGPEFTESLALRPSFPRASLVPAPANSKRQADEPRFVLHAQAAAIFWGLVQGRLTFRPHRSDAPPTGAAARELLFRCLYEKTQHEGRFGEPHEVYTQWAFTPVPAALAVLRVHRSKFDKEAPMFLALLAYPSVLPFGLSSKLFNQPDNLVRFEPGGILLPPANGGAYPMLSSFLHGVRCFPLGAELRSSIISFSRLSSLGGPRALPTFCTLRRMSVSVRHLRTRFRATWICLPPCRSAAPFRIIAKPLRTLRLCVCGFRSSFLSTVQVRCHQVSLEARRWATQVWLRLCVSIFALAVGQTHGSEAPSRWRG